MNATDKLLGVLRLISKASEELTEALQTYRDVGPLDLLCENSDVSDKVDALKAMLASEIWKDRSTSWISRTLHISDHLVEKVRGEMGIPKPRVSGRNGKSHPGKLGGGK